MVHAGPPSPKFRSPDISSCKMSGLAPRRPSGSRGASCGGGAFGRRGGEGKPDVRWGTHRKPDAQARAWEGRRRFVEDLAERLSGSRAMRRAERSQGDIELA